MGVANIQVSKGLLRERLGLPESTRILHVMESLFSADEQPAIIQVDDPGIDAVSPHGPIPFVDAVFDSKGFLRWELGEREKAQASPGVTSSS